MTDTNQKQEIVFAAFLGIDWADQKHAWALQIPEHRDVERGDLDHTPEAVEAWAVELGHRFGGRPIAVALEQSRGALLFMLTKYAHLVLFPVHPTTLSDYRKGFSPVIGAELGQNASDVAFDTLLADGKLSRDFLVGVPAFQVLDSGESIAWRDSGVVTVEVTEGGTEITETITPTGPDGRNFI